MIDHGVKAIAWRDYDTAVRALSESPASDARRNFDRTGLHFGHLPIGIARSLNETILDAEIIPYRNDDFTPGFITYRYASQEIERMNAISRWRAFDPAAVWLLDDMLDLLKDEVADCLGTPWKVLSLKAWTTPPQADDFGMYAWHSDCFVPEIFKIMIYFVPLSEETGAIEFKIDGNVVAHRSPEPGAWALFRNTDIIHRGVPGTRYERTSIEVTLVRSVAFDLHARFPGDNTSFPAFPWVDGLDGCVEHDAQRAAYEPGGRGVSIWDKIRRKMGGAR